MPTAEQLRSLYRVSYQLTFTMLQPIHLICIDDRTKNLYIDFIDKFKVKEKRRARFLLSLKMVQYL